MGKREGKGREKGGVFPKGGGGGGRRGGLDEARFKKGMMIKDVTKFTQKFGFHMEGMYSIKN